MTRSGHVDQFRSEAPEHEWRSRTARRFHRCEQPNGYRRAPRCRCVSLPVPRCLQRWSAAGCSARGGKHADSGRALCRPTCPLFLRILATTGGAVFDDDGGVNLRVEVNGSDVDQVRSLAAWLWGDAGLRGNVRLVPRPAEPGTLGGGAVDVISLAVGQGGAVALAVSAVITWLRQRTTDVTVKITREHGASSVELVAKRLRAMDAAAVCDMVTELSATLAEDDDKND